MYSVLPPHGCWLSTTFTILLHYNITTLDTKYLNHNYFHKKTYVFVFNECEDDANDNATDWNHRQYPADTLCPWRENVSAVVRRRVVNARHHHDKLKKNNSILFAKIIHLNKY